MGIDPFEYEEDFPAEQLSIYEDGGVCPVYIGDEFKNGRYKIINKLGWGQLATVWAALDTHQDIDVAIKVMAAKISEDNEELRILQSIQQNATQHPGRKHLPQLLDHFYEESRGNRHLFIVTELLGPPVMGITHMLPRYCFSLARARHIIKQLLLAVDCLHSIGIAHGDIYRENILFRRPPSWKLLDFSEVCQYELTRTDGAPIQEGLPRHIVDRIQFEAYLDHEDVKALDQIQLIDFSSSFFASTPPQSIHTPFQFSPPEKIFGKPLSKSVDIWNIGCMTFYLVTCSFPFEAMFYEDEVIPQIQRNLGESATQWVSAALDEAKRNGRTFKHMEDDGETKPIIEHLSECYFDRYDPNRQSDNEDSPSQSSDEDTRPQSDDEDSPCHSNDESSPHKSDGESPPPQSNDKNLPAQSSDGNSPPRINEEAEQRAVEEKELAALGHFIKRALTVDPLKRPTIGELLAEEWINM
ncbi:kinase-like protein [Corynespora cassiicola Philippines]|uniref:Kinase-like protein n=1 Tax=Corynespora cassiicola Philippines TaxID=1448308 RepID=A0A2T2NUD8_CORCC|nr:kinase-like protein [Corynespora cassiicola Philippines]